MGVTARQDGADLCEVQCVDPEKVARAARTMLSVETVTQAAETLRALGDPTRLRIVRALMTEELCVCDLATLVGHTQPTVSHSLRALRQLRLVRFRKEGKIAYYSLVDAHVARLLDEIFQHIEESEGG